MGSPISPMLADLVLQDLEEVVFKKLSFKIHSYYRYVDDTFLIIPNNDNNNNNNFFCRKGEMSPWCVGLCCSRSPTH